MAIVEGRNSLRIGEIGWWRAILAVIFYGLFLHFHKTFSGFRRCHREQEIENGQWWDSTRSQRRSVHFEVTAQKLGSVR